MRPWIRQRSRWLKGYAVTWATHMRRPRELWNDLGPAGFIGFQVLFLGAITSYLALPLFWGALVAGPGVRTRRLARRAGRAGLGLRRGR